MNKSETPNRVINPSLVFEVVDLQAKHAPEDIALEFEGRSQNYAELKAQIDRAASYLLSLGLRKGDRLAWVATNVDLFWTFFLGASKIGVVVAPLNWRLAAVEILQILDDMSAAIVFAERPYLNALRDHESDYTDNIITIDESLEETLRAQKNIAINEEIHPNDTVLQLYTSGTTGLPKGVLLTHRCFQAVAESQFQIGAINPEYENEVILHVLPHFHIAGVTLGLLGWKQSMCVRQHRAFDVADILDEVRQGDPINAFFVPTMINMIVDTATDKEIALDSFVCVSYGAAPMPQALLKKALADMPNASFYQFYGMTETTGGLSVLGSDQHYVGSPYLKSAGQPIPNCEVKIIDPEMGKTLPFGEVGEIIIKCSHIMNGYWNRDEATAASIQDGFYRTGDAGFMDERGYIFLVDRIKDMIISGGENIYPGELENNLSTHPKVSECAFYGKPDKKWGEVVHAMVVPVSGAVLTSEDIMTFLSLRIAKFKLPKTISFSDALPRNASGKVLKRELRERA